ncbi:MAG: class I SAM-dependent methyltransferase [bacterium]
MKSDCPLCGGEPGARMEEGVEEWVVVKAARYFHCRHCDLVFLDPLQRPDESRECERYLEHNNTSEDERYLTYLRGFAEEALLPYVEPPAEVLDFGSGPNPVFAGVLQETGFAVDIYDPLFAPGLEWRDRHYDAVTAVEVAEHLFQPLEEFRRLRDVLRPGGYLALRTLLHYGDRQRFASWWYRQDPTHVCFYSARSFEVLAGLLDMCLVTIKAGRSIVLQR